jgi:hypothetical protein
MGQDTARAVDLAVGLEVDREVDRVGADKAGDTDTDTARKEDRVGRADTVDMAGKVGKDTPPVLLLLDTEGSADWEGTAGWADTEEP